VFTASPVEIIVMLYDAALSHLENAQVAMQQSNRGAAGTYLSRAQRIVAELVSSLDRVGGGDIARRLDGLYAFVLDRLLRGNIRQEPAALAEAARVMGILREAWVIVTPTDKGGSPGAV
jgi:flagellar protein FliS